MKIWDFITHPHMIYKATEEEWRWFVAFWLLMLVMQVTNLTRQVNKLREERNKTGRGE